MSIRIDFWKGSLVAIVLSTLAVWYLGATIYFVWHDQLLASLMLRQADMQYAYEDRIATLKSQLVQETDQAAADRNAVETGFRILKDKAERLDAHASIIDGVVARLRPEAAKATLPSPFSTNNADGLPYPATRSGSQQKASLGQSDQPDNGGQASSTDTLGQKFDRLDDRQSAVLGALAGPTMRTIERLHLVLARTGLALDRWHLSSDTGGPFVPLPDGAWSFERTAALLDEATSQRAALVQIVSRVPVRRPFPGPLDITSSFGARLDPFYGRPAMHTGIDLRENSGEIVAATAAGTVTLAGLDGGYGRMVEIDHGHGVRTRYAHLDAIAVSVGQAVAVGAPIGQVGTSGRTTGPHLHYEVRIDGEPVDPIRFLKAGDDLLPG